MVHVVVYLNFCSIGNWWWKSCNARWYKYYLHMQLVVYSSLLALLQPHVGLSTV